MNRRRVWCVFVAVVALITSTYIPASGQDDRDATLSLNRARMYRVPSAEVWRAVPNVLKSMNLATPKVSASIQFAIAWQLLPMGLPKERRSELRAFVSPFAEPARVYAGSIKRTPSPDDPRAQVVQYNTGELEAAFFTALEKAVGEQGHAIPVRADLRAAAAHRLLGAAADADPCMKRLEDDEPPVLGAEGGVAAPLKLPDSDVPPVYPSAVRRRSVGAEARIDVTIAEDGAIIGARLINADAADEAFTTAIVGAASLWHYRPSRVGGCNVPVRLTLAVQLSKK
jgi:hypothetical protein